MLLCVTLHLPSSYHSIQRATHSHLCISLSKAENKDVEYLNIIKIVKLHKPVYKIGVLYDIKEDFQMFLHAFSYLLLIWLIIFSDICVAGGDVK